MATLFDDPIQRMQNYAAQIRDKYGLNPPQRFYYHPHHRNNDDYRPSHSTPDNSSSDDDSSSNGGSSSDDDSSSDHSSHPKPNCADSGTCSKLKDMSKKPGGGNGFDGGDGQ